MRLRADFAGNTDSLFAALCRSQCARYCAAVETGAHTICSASPELFLSLDGDHLLAKPMKGTSSRGMTLAEDDLRVDQLHNSEKNRAENIMIVDMIRNDMGRIADSGSVVPQKLFAIERYPTVLQMTSEVECRTSASFSSIIGAMFPCASITGAPKVRTMQIISELETSPRGVYTGCIGHVSPGRQAQFNIAIRTVVIDSGSGDAEYGVGGGIVWDSTDMDEYAECLTKAAVVTAGTPPFDLLETMLWQGDEGYWLLDLHLERLSRSSRYFCRDIDVAALRDQVLAFGATLSASRHRVRLLVDQSGTARTESYPLDANVDTVVRLRLAVEPVDKSHPFLYHKTTQRSMYESARAAVTDCDDVVLWNQDREVTETTIANIVIERNGRLITPPISSGLLACTYREHLLNNGEIEEGIITLDDLTSADHIFTINSVRRRQPAELQ